jgi:hypothetical protein
LPDPLAERVLLPFIHHKEFIMDKIIVYLDDPDYSLHQLTPMKNRSAGPAEQTTHWILVACAPHLTRHASQWISSAAVNSWRAKWAETLFAGLVTQLHTQGDQVTTVVAHGNLVALSRKLQLEHGVSHIMDARRPRFGKDLPPLTVDQPLQSPSKWAVPAAMTGMGAALLLASE